MKEHNALIRANYIGGAYGSGPEALCMLKKKLMRIPQEGTIESHAHAVSAVVSMCGGGNGSC